MSGRALAILLFWVVAYGTLVAWLQRGEYSPDSTNYLAAAYNWLHHGRLSVFTNWPNMTLEPVEVPYSVQPFGFPAYLAAFQLVFRDPFISAVLAQGAALVLFFVALRRMMSVARLEAWTQISLLLIVFAAKSFGEIFGYLWTETLFLALTVFLILTICRLFFSGRAGKWDKGLAALLLFLTCSIRFTGVFNLGFFVPPLLRRKMSPRGFAGMVVVAAAPNVLWHLRNRWLTGSNFESHYDWSVSARSVERLQNIFQSLKYALAYDNGFLLAALLALAAAAAWILHRKQKAPDGFDRRPDALLNLVFFGLLAHFVGLSVIGVFSVIGDLLRPHVEQARLLAPVYFLFFLWIHLVLSGLLTKPPASHLSREQRQAQSAGRFLGALGVVVVLALIGNTRFFSFRSRVYFTPRIGYPREYTLWKKLQELPEIRQSTFFYSDYNFVHQIFSGKLQRILWSGYDQGLEKMPTPELTSVTAHLSSPNPPFFVVNDRGPLQASLDARLARWNLTKVGFPKQGFTLYYKRFQVSP